MIRITAPFGFYGAGNIGDEATLNGFARLLAVHRAPAKVSIGSRNPAHTARVEPAFSYFNESGRDWRRWWAKYRATAHAVIGGTPIMDALGEWPLSEVGPLVIRATDRWRVPFVFVGVGVENLRSEHSRNVVKQEMASRVQRWTVRSNRDRQRLLDYGVAAECVTVAADMAWLIESPPGDFGLNRLRSWQINPDRPLIGVNLVNENRILDENPGMVAALAQALDKLIHHLDAQVIFLSNEIRDLPEFDKAAAVRVIAEMKRGDRCLVAPLDYLSPQQMMSIVGHCCLTISMRYHFCLFSALQRVPFVAITRSDKVSDLCWDLGWDAKVVPPKFDADEILGHAIRVTHRPTENDALWRESIAKMKNRALQNIMAIEVLREGRPAPTPATLKVADAPNPTQTPR
ncbi:MAG TPA: polysaccharide pyruvyl transferase family protein [Candidatus Didemnitutus sp.]|nr:polysaccharide pyruvyl transferase family protein [Candidatus Didemnitutus sp.]